MALVVNLFGVPGCGKSTGAAYLFYRLKAAGINAELVTEFAKDKVWEENSTALSNQAYIFGKQAYKIARCADKVDVVITDSPLPLCVFYNKDPVLGEDFNKVVMNVFNSYTNINFLLHRVKPYNPSGRLQTEKESDAMHKPIKKLLDDNNIKYVQNVPGNKDGYKRMFEYIMASLNTQKIMKERKER